MKPLFPARMALVAMAVVSTSAVAAAPTAIDAGRAVYLRNCALCHAPGGPATILLSRRLGASRALLATRDDLSPVLIRHVVRNGIGGMPWLTPVELPEADLDALVAYLTRRPDPIALEDQADLRSAPVDASSPARRRLAP